MRVVWIVMIARRALIGAIALTALIFCSVVIAASVLILLIVLIVWIALVWWIGEAIFRTGNLCKPVRRKEWWETAEQFCKDPDIARS